MDTKQLFLSADGRWDALYTVLMPRSVVARMYGSKLRSRSMSESQSKGLYEVQTYTVCDGWVNCWTIEDEKPEVFDTPHEAEAAIYEFFADLGSSGMAQSYSMEDYRVVLRKNALSD